jgi:hypothetical protein
MNSENRRVRHSREGVNPEGLQLLRLDSRLRGNDKLVDSHASSTLCYLYESTFVSAGLRARSGPRSTTLRGEDHRNKELVWPLACSPEVHESILLYSGIFSGFT